jgi:hypothetical protein
MEIEQVRSFLLQIRKKNHAAPVGGIVKVIPSPLVIFPKYVRFWHKADISRLSSNVRYWGQSGLTARRLKRSAYLAERGPRTTY